MRDIHISVSQRLAQVGVHGQTWNDISDVVVLKETPRGGTVEGLGVQEGGLQGVPVVDTVAAAATVISTFPFFLKLVVRVRGQGNLCGQAPWSWK